MYSNGSSEFNTLINTVGSNSVKIKLVFNGFEITSIKSLVLNGGTNNSGDIAIGTTTSAYIDAEISTDKAITNKEFQLMAGMELSDGSVEYISMGYFTVQKTEDNEGFIKFTACDRMFKFEKVYKSSLTYPTNSVAVLNELCTKCGIQLATTGLNSITIKDKLDGYTCREVLGFIAAIYGCFACFDRNGQLLIRWYSTSLVTKQLSYIWSLSKDQSDFKVDFVTFAKDSENTYTKGSGLTGINASNPYATQSITDSVYNARNGFTYRTAEMSMLDDIRLDPWDIIKVTYTDGSILKIPVMSLIQDFTNGSTKIKSYGKSESEAQYNYAGPVTQSVDRLTAEVLVTNQIVATKIDAEWVRANAVMTDNLSAKVAEIDDLKATDAIITNLNTTLLTTENITAKIADVGYLKADSAVITDLQTNKLNTSDLTASVANINTLKATDAIVENLKSNLITANNIKALNLEVGNQIAMGENAVISWNNVTDISGINFRNYIPYPYYHKTGRVSRGVTYTVDEKTGIIIANGTATGGLSTFFINSSEYENVPTELIGQTVTLSNEVYINGAYIRIDFYDATDVSIANYTANRSSNTFVVPENAVKWLIRLCVTEDITVENRIFKPMLELGTKSHVYSPTPTSDFNYDKTYTQISKDTITTEYIQAKAADFDSATIGTMLANVGLIDSTTMSEGKVTSLLSAVKIDAGAIATGTLDASKITVNNLNANSITVGTINGQLIGEGSISISAIDSDFSGKITGIESDVSDALTAAGLNTTAIANLQEEVDGNIQTWTSTPVPTLTNYPASQWTTKELKDNHVGDLYYDGNNYCYRFRAKNETEYEWVKLQDTDVSKAVGDAAKAVTIASGKNTAYYQATTPATPEGGFSVNDVWYKTNEGNKMYAWNGTQWIAQQYGTQAIVASAITSELINAEAITSGKIATGAIVADKIASNAITSDKILANAITTAKINAGAVNADKIASNAIEAKHIKTGTITGDLMEAQTITGDLIAAQTITGSNIVANTITSTELATETINVVKSSTRNLIANMSFQPKTTNGVVSIPNWSYSAFFTLDDTVSLYGANSVKFTRTGLTEESVTVLKSSKLIPCVAGEKYTASIYAKAKINAEIDRIYLCVRGYTADSNRILQSVRFETSITSENWTRVQNTVTIPADVTDIVLEIRAYKNGELWLACPQIQSGDRLTVWDCNPYGANATSIDGGQIATSSISADRIRTSELIVGENIAMGANAKISWGQVTGTDDVATTSDIPTKVSDLTNDSGFQNSTQVTTITRTEISTAQINANQITAGLIKANQIDTSELVVGDNISMGDNAVISWDNVTNSTGVKANNILTYPYYFADEITVRGTKFTVDTDDGSIELNTSSTNTSQPYYTVNRMLLKGGHWYTISGNKLGDGTFVIVYFHTDDTYTDNKTPNGKRINPVDGSEATMTTYYISTHLSSTFYESRTFYLAEDTYTSFQVRIPANASVSGATVCPMLEYGKTKHDYEPTTMTNDAFSGTITRITQNTVSAEYIKGLNLEVGNQIKMGANATISWDNVTGTSDVATISGIEAKGYQNATQVTTISRNEISTATINACQINSYANAENLLSNPTWQGNNDAIKGWTKNTKYSIDPNTKNGLANSVKYNQTTITTNTNANFYSDNIACTPGKTFTVSIYALTNNASGITENSVYLGASFSKADGTTSAGTWANTYVLFENEKWKRTSLTFTTPDECYNIKFYLRARRNGTFWFTKPQLQKGDTLADWSNNIYSINSTTIEGNQITTGSITADRIDVADLFAQNITATGTITGATLIGADARITKGSIGAFVVSTETDTSKHTFQNSLYTKFTASSSDYEAGIRPAGWTDQEVFYVKKKPTSTSTWGGDDTETPFSVLASGKLIANNAVIKGTISAGSIISAGSSVNATTANTTNIGSWICNGDDLYKMNNGKGTGLSVGGTYAIGVGFTSTSSWANAPFRVDHNGKVTASAINISSSNASDLSTLGNLTIDPDGNLRGTEYSSENYRLEFYPSGKSISGKGTVFIALVNNQGTIVRYMTGAGWK